MVREYDASYLSMDPLEQVRRYADPADQEAAAFIAALLALGRYEKIRETVQGILSGLGDHPARAIRHLNPEDPHSAFPGFGYRFYRGRDLGLLLSWIRQMLHRSGSIRGFFMEGFDPRDPHIGPSLSRFVQAVRTLDTQPFYSRLPESGHGASHFLTDPARGSACKRLNLFLRWVVRTGPPDLGLWRDVPPAMLVIPLDTHIARLGKRLGLTRRVSADWTMALEITEALKSLDAADPVKYDFALCTIGKLTACPAVPSRSACSACPLMPFCSRIRKDKNPAAAEAQPMR